MDAQAEHPYSGYMDHSGRWAEWYKKGCWTGLKKILNSSHQLWSTGQDKGSYALFEFGAHDLMLMARINVTRSEERLLSGQT